MRCTAVLLASLLIAAAGFAERAGLEGREGSSMEKILVVYASKTGSTAEIAEAIAKELRAEGAAVDVFSAKDAPAPDGYTSAVIGSGIYMGKWRADSTAYLKKHAAGLKAMPVAYFQVCMTIKDETEKNRAAVDAYANTARSLVPPVETVSFAGRVDPARLGFLDRMAVKMVKSPIGDFRDWNKIAAWARHIHPLLLPKSVTP